MRSFFLVACAACAVSVMAQASPVHAASDVFSWQGGSGIISQTEASASSGGEMVSGSQSVQTGSASASVQTTVSDGASGGTSTLWVTTTQNGVSSSERLRKHYVPGQAVTLRLATSTRSASSSASITPQAPPSKGWFTGFLARISRWLSFSYRWNSRL